MNKKTLPLPPTRLSMRVILTMVITVAYSAITVAAFLVTLLLKYFGITVIIPDVVSYLIMGVLLGVAVSLLVGVWIFTPIARLGNAMGLVARGNFDIRLKEKHTFREIEEMNRNFNLMTRELSNTEILQTDFVSNVSHEFKTPINAIEGYATLLQGESENMSEDQQQYVDKILFNTQRLSKLVGNILLLSKVDNQAIQSQKTRFRLDEQIRQSILHLESEWTKKDIEFDVDLQHTECTGYETLLLHVWSNLIGNAIKFNPVGGLVEIRLTKQKGTALFTIRDSGPGIPLETQKHIFDRFYQSDSSHKEEGNGLGLALVKQILEISSGMVSVSNHPDGGCLFTVILPLS